MTRKIYTIVELIVQVLSCTYVECIDNIVAVCFKRSTSNRLFDLVIFRTVNKVLNSRVPDAKQFDEVLVSVVIDWLLNKLCLDSESVTTRSRVVGRTNGIVRK